MSRLVLLLTLVYLTRVQGETREEKILQILAQCKSEFPVTDDELTLMEMKKEFNNKNMKCFLNCVSEKRGFMKDGKVQMEFLAEKIKEWNNSDPTSIEEKLRVVELCKDQADGDPCEAAVKVYICFIENRKQTNIVIDG